MAKQTIFPIKLSIINSISGFLNLFFLLFILLPILFISNPDSGWGSLIIGVYAGTIVFISIPFIILFMIFSVGFYRKYQIEFDSKQKIFFKISTSLLVIEILVNLFFYRGANFIFRF
jgi:hypothetical protein